MINEEKFTKKEWEIAEEIESIARSLVRDMGNIERDNIEKTRTDIKNELPDFYDLIKKLEGIL